MQVLVWGKLEERGVWDWDPLEGKLGGEDRQTSAGTNTHDPPHPTEAPKATQLGRATPPPSPARRGGARCWHALGMPWAQPHTFLHARQCPHAGPAHRDGHTQSAQATKGTHSGDSASRTHPSESGIAKLRPRGRGAWARGVQTEERDVGFICGPRGFCDER